MPLAINDFFGSVGQFQIQTGDGGGYRQIPFGKLLNWLDFSTRLRRQL